MELVVAVAEVAAAGAAAGAGAGVAAARIASVESAMSLANMMIAGEC